MNHLQEYFEKNKGRCIDKWMHYFDIYDLYFSKFRDTEVHVMEIGVSDGGSLQMWKSYFGEKSYIYGVDINPHCKLLEEDQIKIYIGDQANSAFLNQLINEVGKIDVLIDDGGHFFDQQIATFKALYPLISENGVYICEDLHTSYWKKGYGGGKGRSSTFIEFGKNLIDELNAWHYTENSDLSDFAKSAYALHFYDSMMVVEKKPKSKPEHRITGTEKVQTFTRKMTLSKKILRRIKLQFG